MSRIVTNLFENRTVMIKPNDDNNYSPEARTTKSSPMGLPEKFKYVEPKNLRNKWFKNWIAGFSIVTTITIAISFIVAFEYNTFSTSKRVSSNGTISSASIGTTNGTNGMNGTNGISLPIQCNGNSSDLGILT